MWVRGSDKRKPLWLWQPNAHACNCSVLTKNHQMSLLHESACACVGVCTAAVTFKFHTRVVNSPLLLPWRLSLNVLWVCERVCVCERLRLSLHKTHFSCRAGALLTIMLQGFITIICALALGSYSASSPSQALSSSCPCLTSIASNNILFFVLGGISMKRLGSQHSPLLHACRCQQTAFKCHINQQGQGILWYLWHFLNKLMILRIKESRVI